MPPRPSRPAAILLLLAATSASAQQRWTLVPELRIGSVDDPATALSPVGDILIGADGRLYVSQSQQKEIRIYSPDGELLRVIGGEGSGPGEFRNVSNLSWRGDTLQVLDFAQQRFSLFAADGDFIRTYRPLPRGAIVRHLVSAEFPDGSVFARVRGGSEGLQPLLRITGEGPPDTLAWMSTDRRYVRARVGGAVFSTVHPIPAGDHFRVDERARYVTVVRQPAPESSDSAHFRVRRITPAGESVFDRWFRYSPRPVTEEEVANAVTTVRRGMLNVRGRTPPALARHFRADAVERALREELAFPEYHAPVSELRIGRDGTTWLRLHEGEADQQWLVLDDAGDPAARLRVPPSLRIRAADRRHVWGVELDELDVPYVVRYRVQVLEERQDRHGGDRIREGRTTLYRL